MKKNELLEKIKSAINAEESASTVYLGHLKALMARSQLDPAIVKEAQTGIGELIKANQDHRHILETLQREVEKEPGDDF
jgi:rubrerythrin